MGISLNFIECLCHFVNLFRDERRLLQLTIDGPGGKSDYNITKITFDKIRSVGRDVQCSLTNQKWL